jgi:hypothetical protein
MKMNFKTVAQRGRTAILAMALIPAFFMTSCEQDEIEPTQVEPEAASVNLKATTPTDGKTYYIKSAFSGKYLDVSGYSTVNGGNIQQWKYTGATNQQFKLTEVSSGVYKIVGVQSGKALDVSAYSLINGGNIQQWTYKAGDNQKFTFVSGASGYAIKGVQSGKVLDVAAWSTDNGGNIQQWTYKSQTNQQWVFTEVSSTSSTIPGVVLGLTSDDWKLNGYIDSPTSDPDYEDDVLIAAGKTFSTYSNSYYFYSDGEWTFFKCYRGLEGSSSSGNPRSELREMMDGDDDTWTNSGTNRMRWTARVDQLAKSHNSDAGGKVCIGQIHGPSGTYDDVIRVQFEGTAAQSTGAVSLVVNGWVCEDETGDDDGIEISGSWYLDTEYTFELIFEDDEVILNRISGSTTTQLYKHSNCGSDENYFKVGNYMQSVQEDDYDGTYSLVAVKDLSVTH